MSKLYNQEQAAIALGVCRRAVHRLVLKLSDEDKQRFIRRDGKPRWGNAHPWSTTTEGIEALRQAQRVVKRWESGDKDKVLAEFRRSGSISAAAQAGGTYYDKAYQWVRRAGLIVPTPRHAGRYNGIRRDPYEILRESYEKTKCVTKAAKASGLGYIHSYNWLVAQKIHQPKRASITEAAMALLSKKPVEYVAKKLGLRLSYVKSLQRYQAA